MATITIALTDAQVAALDAEAKKNGGSTGDDATAYCQGLCARQADSILSAQDAALLNTSDATEKAAALAAIKTVRAAKAGK